MANATSVTANATSVTANATSVTANATSVTANATSVTANATSVTANATSGAAVVLRDVGKRFGERVALTQLSLAIAPGEIVGLLGPNGSGKTTCLRIISGFLDPDAGAAYVAGHAVMEERMSARAAVGYMPESVPLYQDMRVAQHLVFHARLRGLSRDGARRRVAQVMAACGLDGMRSRVIGRLSKGYRQRVGLAQALLSEPRVLLLDEPTAGLDPGQVRDFRALVRDEGERRTVIISSHMLEHLQALADRFIVLANGRLVGDGTLEALRESAGMGQDTPLERVFLALTEGGGDG